MHSARACGVGVKGGLPSGVSGGFNGFNNPDSRDHRARRAARRWGQVLRPSRQLGGRTGGGLLGLILIILLLLWLTGNLRGPVVSVARIPRQRDRHSGLADLTRSAGPASDPQRPPAPPARTRPRHRSSPSRRTRRPRPSGCLRQHRRPHCPASARCRTRRPNPAQGQAHNSARPSQDVPITSRRPAPSAIQTPISRRRWATRCDSTPHARHRQQDGDRREAAHQHRLKSHWGRHRGG